MIGIHAGVANLWDTDMDLTVVSMDYRHRPFSPFRLVPSVGWLFGDDGAYIFFGDLQRNFWANDRIGATLYGGAGLFHCGPVLDLNYPLEFRVGLETFYRLDSNSRIGVRYLHMSNAGFGDTNPATEAVLLSYTIALNR